MRKFRVAFVALLLLAVMAVPAFAAEEVITEEALSPVLDDLKGFVGVIIPVGISIFAIAYGVRLVRDIFVMFSHDGFSATSNGDGIEWDGDASFGGGYFDSSGNEWFWDDDTEQFVQYD